MLLAAGSGFGLTLVLHRYDLSIFSLVLVIPLVAAAIFLIASKETEIGGPSVPFSRFRFSNLAILNAVIFAATLIPLFVSYVRPLVYFILIAIYAGVLFLQIISARPKWTDSLIVGQIIILSLNLIWGTTLKYPLYFGDTDLLVHFNLIDTIIKTGHVAAYNVDYLHYPMYHIFNALGVEITGGTLNVMLFILMGVAWQIGIIFAFLIFLNLSNSSKLAGIASLLFALSSQTIFYGSYSIARSLAFVFFICWVFLVLKAGTDRRYLFLSIIALAAMIVTHHLNVLFAIPVLGLIYVCQIIVNRFRQERPLNPLFIYLLTIGALSYLIWVASNLADSILPGTIRSMLSETGLKSSASLTHGFGISVILGTLYYSFAFFLSLLGIKRFFDHLAQKSHFSGTFALTGITALVLYVPGFMYLFPFSDILLTDRLILIVAPFVTFLMAYGVDYLCQAKISWAPLFAKTAYPALIPTILLIATTFFSVISIGDAKDTNYFPHTATVDSPYFTESELASFSFLDNDGSKATSVYTDYAASRNDYMLATFADREIIRSGGLLDIPPGAYLMLRTGELQKKQSLGFLPETSGPTDLVRYPIDQLLPEIRVLDSSASASKIFSDKNVQIYVAKVGSTP